MRRSNSSFGNGISTPQSCNLLTPRHGVITLHGFGITVYVNRGHLILRTVSVANHREGRFARVGHDVRRLVVIGSHGSVSLAALRWLADQDAAFVMLERGTSTTRESRLDTFGLLVIIRAFALRHNARFANVIRFLFLADFSVRHYKRDRGRRELNTSRTRFATS